ncbi:MAG: anti-sigma factor [Pseudomonadota bacterium]
MNFRERWGLRFHLWMCRNCRRFERQIALMRRLLRQSDLNGETETSEFELPAEARERIGRVLADQHSRTARHPSDREPRRE